MGQVSNDCFGLRHLMPDVCLAAFVLLEETKGRRWISGFLGNPGSILVVLCLFNIIFTIEVPLSAIGGFWVWTLGCSCARAKGVLGPFAVVLGIIIVSGWFCAYTAPNQTPNTSCGPLNFYVLNLIVFITSCLILLLVVPNQLSTWICLENCFPWIYIILP